MNPNGNPAHVALPYDFNHTLFKRKATNKMHACMHARHLSVGRQEISTAKKIDLTSNEAHTEYIAIGVLISNFNSLYYMCITFANFLISHFFWHFCHFGQINQRIEIEEKGRKRDGKRKEERGRGKRREEKKGEEEEKEKAKERERFLRYIYTSSTALIHVISHHQLHPSQRYSRAKQKSMEKLQ
jgi:hypothetical protein